MYMHVTCMLQGCMEKSITVGIYQFKGGGDRCMV